MKITKIAVLLQKFKKVNSQASISEKDNDYWNEFYKENNVPNKSSSFAKSVLELIDKKKSLIELGCGNGRDSFFFARNGVETIGVDLSAKAIELNNSFNHANVKFQNGDFTKLHELPSKNIGSIYSRFTLHSIDKKSYDRVLNWCSNVIKPGMKFFIEARTVNDPLFGVGESVGNNGFITSHYRRFLIIQDVIKELEEKYCFNIISAIEDWTSSWYKDDHAVVLRIICEKK